MKSRAHQSQEISKLDNNKEMMNKNGIAEIDIDWVRGVREW